MKLPIDMNSRRFLDFGHFVIPGAGRNALPPVWLPLACALLVLGCAPRVPQNTVEDTPTSGRITVVATPDLRDLIAREAEAFQATYPQGRIEVRTDRSGRAVGGLLDASVSLAAIPREMLPEEKVAAQAGRVEIEGYRFARDALVMIAHPANRVENVTVDEIAAIYEGELRSWRALGGEERAVVPVIQAVTSDATIAFVEQALGGDTLRAPAHVAADDSAAVAFVRATPGALAFVSMAAPLDGVKPLAVSRLTGLPYVHADVQTVHDGEYPLMLPLTLYVRTSGPRLAHGFITWVTSHDGQKIVHEAGRVPTSVPVRFVRRSPMLGSH